MATNPTPASASTRPALPTSIATAASTTLAEMKDLIAHTSDKVADAKEADLVEGKKAFLTSAVGRLIHPYQDPLEFKPGVVTPVVVDRWVIVQFEAGKLKLAD